MLVHKIKPFGSVRPCVGPFRPALHGACRRYCSRASTVVVQANEKSDAILEKAKTVYKSGDRLQAMKLYEDVLADEPTVEQRRAALFGVMSVHAAFGDVELAQMTLREAMRYGLDYEKAIVDPRYVDMVTSPQITIQLRRFAQQVNNALANRPAAERPYGSSAATAARRRPTGGGQDLDSILGSATGEQAEVDTSIPGIIRRVLLVILVGVALGVGLWYLGLEYLFPKLD